MPIAESSAPIVVGLRATSSAIQHGLRGERAGVRRVGPQRHDRGQEGDGEPGEQNVQRDLVRRLALLRAFDEGDHAVEGHFPGSWVTSMTSLSESTVVPPVTAERSPPDSRMTGADSPVIADSSTEQTPSMISPSAGMCLPPRR